jgi:hypothetical protein
MRDSHYTSQLVYLVPDDIRKLSSDLPRDLERRTWKKPKYVDMIKKYAEIIRPAPICFSRAADHLIKWVTETVDTPLLDVSYCKLKLPGPLAVTPKPTTKVDSDCQAIALEPAPGLVKLVKPPKASVPKAPTTTPAKVLDVSASASAKSVYSMAANLVEHQGKAWPEAVKLAEELLQPSGTHVAVPAGAIAFEGEGDLHGDMHEDEALDVVPLHAL